jgi:glutaredoxin
MKEKKNYIIIGATLVILGIVVFWGLRQPEKAVAPTVQPSDEIVYYYGEECPHCKEVAKFLEENKIAEKVNFSKKEVWSNAANAAEMEQRASECNIERSGMGVPFLYARGKCYIGTPDVEAFFRQEAGI